MHLDQAKQTFFTVAEDMPVKMAGKYQTTSLSTENLRFL